MGWCHWCNKLELRPWYFSSNGYVLQLCDRCMQLWRARKYNKGTRSN